MKFRPLRPLRPLPGWIVLGILAVAHGNGAGAATIGEEVARFNFQSPESLAGAVGADAPGIRLAEGYQGAQALEFERPAAAGTSPLTEVRMPLPIEKLAGTRVAVQALVRATGVTQTVLTYQGVKVSIHAVSPSGDVWSQQSGVYGTFDWKELSFEATVPPDATAAWLVMGLDNAAGEMEVDNVVMKTAEIHRTPLAQVPTGPVFTGHALPRLRGAMEGPHLQAADLNVLGTDWNANLVRHQLIWHGFGSGPEDKDDLPAYDAWLQSAIAELDANLPAYKKAGLLVCVDLHTPPGGRDANHCFRLMEEPKVQEDFLRNWAMIARHYRGNPQIWSYDLVNEPIEGMVPDGVLHWHDLAAKAARLVRSIDPDHAIVVEPGQGGQPQALDYFQPIPVPGIVYSVHMYYPHLFTHQGVFPDCPLGTHYPGLIDGKMWDKAALRTVLQPAIDYAHDYHVAIYIGEFSAIRWAPKSDAENYLKDVISLFEENGWDWSYHAFREWQGWSVELGSDQNDLTPSPTPTGRELLLRSYYKLNVKPPTT